MAKAMVAQPVTGDNGACTNGYNRISTTLSLRLRCRASGESHGKAEGRDRTIGDRPGRSHSLVSGVTRLRVECAFVTPAGADFVQLNDIAKRVLDENLVGVVTDQALDFPVPYALLIQGSLGFFNVFHG